VKFRDERCVVKFTKSCVPFCAAADLDDISIGKAIEESDSNKARTNMQLIFFNFMIFQG
jgi:hypothetical protein